jgi:hypothetical protein
LKKLLPVVLLLLLPPQARCQIDIIGKKEIQNLTYYVNYPPMQSSVQNYDLTRTSVRLEPLSTDGKTFNGPYGLGWILSLKAGGIERGANYEIRFRPDVSFSYDIQWCRLCAYLFPKFTVLPSNRVFKEFKNPTYGGMQLGMRWVPRNAPARP